MSVKFKFNKDPAKVIELLRISLNDAIQKARAQIAGFLYEELYKTSPVDTMTYKYSWERPEEIHKGYKIQNILPQEYIASGDNHIVGERIATAYNMFILEGTKAGAPNSYILTQNQWIYKNIAAGKLQDVNMLLWKFNQGALGLNPYTLLNALFSRTVRRNI